MSREQLAMPLARARGVIEPWFSDPLGRYHLVLGDCVETMRRIPDQSVDLVFADPPYFLSNGGTTCASGERVSVAKGEWDESRGLELDHAFHLCWLEQARAVLKPSGTIWVSATHHALFSIGWAMQLLGFHLLNLVTWGKPNASPNLACRMFTHSAEQIIWAAPALRDPLPHFFDYAAMKRENGGKQMRDYWPIPTTPAREKMHGAHACQKPEKLLERVIAASSRPGDLVLDPFCGSGTSGVVAVRRGRRFIGVELSSNYLVTTKRRLLADGKAQR